MKTVSYQLYIYTAQFIPPEKDIATCLYVECHATTKKTKRGENTSSIKFARKRCLSLSTLNLINKKSLKNINFVSLTFDAVRNLSLIRKLDKPANNVEI